MCATQNTILLNCVQHADFSLRIYGRLGAPGPQQTAFNPLFLRATCACILTFSSRSRMLCRSRLLAQVLCVMRLAQVFSEIQLKYKLFNNACAHVSWLYK
jgi:hypothetical protein